MRDFTKYFYWFLALVTVGVLALALRVEVQASSSDAVAASIRSTSLSGFSTKTVTNKCTLTFEPPPNEENQSCAVKCPKGTVLLSGGGVVTGGSQEILVNSTWPGGGNAWQVSWYPDSTLTQQEQVPVTVYAICTP